MLVSEMYEFVQCHVIGMNVNFELGQLSHFS